MLAGFVKCGNVEDAFGLFSEMPCRDVVSWNSMLACYAQCGKPNEALALFDQMRAVGVKPSEATVVSLLSACAHLGALDKGCILISIIIELRSIPLLALHLWTCMRNVEKFPLPRKFLMQWSPKMF